jgi:glycosyltransferase involved in cell wall biosynthesis
MTSRSVEIALPVYNEVDVLEDSVARLDAFLGSHIPFPTRIAVVDNGSNDGTQELAQALATERGRMRVLRIEEKGRGRALRAAWSTSTADVVAYMDVDLSTGLGALLPLLAPVVSGHSVGAVGNRLMAGACTVRGARREVLSRGYNVLLRSVCGARFGDAQCGFKAFDRLAVLALLPLVENEEWFFDTELLLLAQQRGLRVIEIPVDWIDDPRSKVDLLPTILEDLSGVARVARSKMSGRFGKDGW